MISNNNSQGSDSPLPSPRFSRYIRTPGTSDNSSDSNSSGRPSSATTSSNYKTRVGGNICSQSPNVTNLGKKWGKSTFKEHPQIYFSSSLVQQSWVDSNRNRGTDGSDVILRNRNGIETGSFLKNPEPLESEPKLRTAGNRNTIFGEF